MWTLEFVVECSEDRAEALHDLLLGYLRELQGGAEAVTGWENVDLETFEIVDGGGVFLVDEAEDG